jgi:cytochrome c-type biogenesis protein CcmF
MTFNDYVGLLGFSGISLGLGLSIIGLIANAYHLIKNDRSIGWLFRTLIVFQFICLALAVFCLGGLLLNNAFEFPIVFESIEKSMPWIQKLSGLWSGQSSSLLFWSFILSFVFLLISRLSRRMIGEQFSSLVSLILGIALVFFLIPVLAYSNPFEKLWQMPNGLTTKAIFAPFNAGLIVPVDGIGMNPSLRHIAMLLHPPFLYLGLVLFFVPYAVSLTALIKREKNNKWVNLLMPITLNAWIYLSIGMILGSWWAYTILGWGGYWGWDAVEIAGLLPWLLSFGLIHSIRMQLAGKDFLRWIVLLSGLIFITILSGILITRSGILESVHAYSAGVMGPILSAFIVLNIFVFGFYLAKNWKSLKNSKDQIKYSLPDLLPRVFNFSILALVLIYFIGQSYPLTSQLFTGTQTSWKPEQYEIYSSPLLILLLLNTAICPFLNLFDKNRKKFWQTGFIMLGLSLLLPLFMMYLGGISFIQLLGFWFSIFLFISWFYFLFIEARRFFTEKVDPLKTKIEIIYFGSILIHIGIGLLAIGIMSQETFGKTYDLSIGKGETDGISSLKIESIDTPKFVSPEGTTISKIELSLTEKGQHSIFLSPSQEFYPKMNVVYSRPVIATSLKRDIQIILVNWTSNLDSKSEIRVTINPLMIWIWIGGAIMIAGGVISLFTPRRTN